MTARDAGNALWGGVIKNDYGVTILGVRIGLTSRGMRMTSDAAAAAGKTGKFTDVLRCGFGSATCEDFTSRSMQNWGYSRGF